MFNDTLLKYKTPFILLYVCRKHKFSTLLNKTMLNSLVYLVTAPDLNILVFTCSNYINITVVVISEKESQNIVKSVSDLNPLQGKPGYLHPVVTAKQSLPL